MGLLQNTCRCHWHSYSWTEIIYNGNTGDFLARRYFEDTDMQTHIHTNIHTSTLSPSSTVCGSFQKGISKTLLPFKGSKNWTQSYENVPTINKNNEIPETSGQIMYQENRESMPKFGQS